jgi:hypothetical protein
MSLRFLNGTSCPCFDGYVSVNGICLPCHYSCVTCFDLLTYQCLTCNPSFRYANPNNHSCDCADGTFDNGVNLQCQQCNQRCVTCVDFSSVSCTTCNASQNRWMNPQNSPSSCFCLTHYFDDGATVCSLCDNLC